MKVAKRVENNKPNNYVKVGKKWQEKEIQPQKPLNTKEEVFETVLNVFDNELIYDQDCASLYQILMIYYYYL